MSPADDPVDDPTHDPATDPTETSITGEPLHPQPLTQADTPDAEPTAASPRSVRLSSIATALVALLAVAAIVGAVLTWREVRADRAADRSDAAALDAGRDAAVAFTSYDYQQLDTDLARVSDMSTGTFKKQFTSALSALTTAIKQAEGVSQGRIVYAGLRERSGHMAVVLVAADASITNNSSEQQSTRRYRLQITLDDRSGAWLISDIAPVA